MDKVKYKGEYALLLDTNDLVGRHYWLEIDIKKAMETNNAKYLLVITSLPLSSLPLSIRQIVSKDQTNCYRGAIE